MSIKLNDVIDEFLYRYADEGGNFDDPFLKIVHSKIRQFDLAESIIKQQQLEIKELKAEREFMFGYVKSRGEVGQLIVYKASLEAQEK